MNRNIYIPLGIFAICFITLSILYVPSNTHIEYVYPCKDVAQLDRVLPLACGKTVFKYEQGKLVASVEDVVIDVARVVNGSLLPISEEMFNFYQFCCETRYEPRKVIDMFSLAKNLVLTLLISAIPSLIAYILLRRTKMFIGHRRISI